MKTTDFITENLVMAAQEAQSDHEVNMARAQCYNAAQHAIEIHKLLKNISEMQGIEGWVASKLTLAEDYLNTVRDYLTYEAHKEDQMDEFNPESATATLDSVLGEARKPEYNFDIEDIRKLENIRDLETVKTLAMQLISKPSERPMKPEKIEWFRAALDRMNSPIKVVKLMYDLLLSGEGHSVIGSKSSMNPNSYRARFNEQDVTENATAGATGSAAIASTPGARKGKKVGTLFGGSYKPAKK
jgi:hypothetical protein